MCEKEFKIPDGRSLAAARRKLAQTKGTEVMLDLLKEAVKAGHKADYVLFDSWFSSPAQLLDVKNLGFDCIAMVKKNGSIIFSVWPGTQTPAFSDLKIA